VWSNHNLPRSEHVVEAATVRVNATGRTNSSGTGLKYIWYSSDRLSSPQKEFQKVLLKLFSKFCDLYGYAGSFWSLYGPRLDDVRYF
jgi:hypothetical protein